MSSSFIRTNSLSQFLCEQVFSSLLAVNVTFRPEASLAVCSSDITLYLVGMVKSIVVLCCSRGGICLSNAIVYSVLFGT